MAKVEWVVSSSEVVSKPSAPKGGNQSKVKETPPRSSKRASDDAVSTDTSKKQKVAPSSPNALVPSLRDDKGSPIPIGAIMFSDHVLATRLNHVTILPQDYDTRMVLEEAQCLARLERAPY